MAVDLHIFSKGLKGCPIYALGVKEGKDAKQASPYLCVFGVKGAKMQSICLQRKPAPSYVCSGLKGQRCKASACKASQPLAAFSYIIIFNMIKF